MMTVDSGDPSKRDWYAFGYVPLLQPPADFFLEFSRDFADTDITRPPTLPWAGVVRLVDSGSASWQRKQPIREK